MAVCKILVSEHRLTEEEGREVAVVAIFFGMCATASAAMIPGVSLGAQSVADTVNGLNNGDGLVFRFTKDDHRVTNHGWTPMNTDGSERKYRCPSVLQPRFPETDFVGDSNSYQMRPLAPTFPAGRRS